MERGWIAVPEVAEEIRPHMSFRKELLFAAETGFAGSRIRKDVAQHFLALQKALMRHLGEQPDANHSASVGIKARTSRPRQHHARPNSSANEAPRRPGGRPAARSMEQPCTLAAGRLACG